MPSRDLAHILVPAHDDRVVHVRGQEAQRVVGLEAEVDNSVEVLMGPLLDRFESNRLGSTGRLVRRMQPLAEVDRIGQAEREPIRPKLLEQAADLRLDVAASKSGVRVDSDQAVGPLDLFGLGRREAVDDQVAVDQEMGLTAHR